MRTDRPTPLSSSERALLLDLLAHDFAGVEALRVQARAVAAVPGCGCGCGTIELTPLGTDLPRSDAESPVPVAGDVLDAEGEPVGGLLLFVGDGLLSSLEVYSEADVDPLPLPRADRVRWSDRAHASDPAD